MIEQKSSRRFVGAHGSGDFTAITQPRTESDTQRWYLLPVGDVFTLQQQSSRHFADAHRLGPGDINLTAEGSSPHTGKPRAANGKVAFPVPTPTSNIRAEDPRRPKAMMRS